MWDGVAVMTEPPPLGSRVPDLGFPGLSVLCVIGATLLGPKLTSARLVVSLTALVAAAASQMPHTGIVRSPLALGSLQARFFDGRFPEIDYSQLTQQMKKPHFLVDARTKAAYAWSHIPGALSVPINSGLISFSSAAQLLSVDLPVVVYCQSDRCSWADEVASQLRGRGVKNIRIYRGGMNDWTSRKH